jgi:hypothetical protein
LNSRGYILIGAVSGLIIVAVVIMANLTAETITSCCSPPQKAISDISVTWAIYDDFENQRSVMTWTATFTPCEPAKQAGEQADDFDEALGDYLDNRAPEDFGSASINRPTAGTTVEVSWNSRNLTEEKVTTFLERAGGALDQEGACS